MGESTIEDFDKLIEGYIEHGGPDAVSFTAFGEILADLEAESVQETVELTGLSGAIPSSLISRELPSL